VHVTELPIGLWTDAFKSHLDKITLGRHEEKKSKVKPCVVKYKIGNRQDDQNVDLYIELDQPYEASQIETMLKLSESKTCAYSNMHVFDPIHRLCKFETPLNLLLAFCKFRRHFYEFRRQYQLQLLKRDAIVLTEKVRFMQEVMDGKLTVMNRPKKDIAQLLIQHKYTPNPHHTPIRIPRVSTDQWNQDSEDYVLKNTSLYSRVIDRETDHGGNDADCVCVEEKEFSEDPGDPLLAQFRYLVSISMYHFSQEEVQKLKSDWKKTVDQMDGLERQTGDDLWLQDLDDLEKELVLHNKSNL
jgi:DNA topoisomerase-2